MPHPPKHPQHKVEAEALMNELLDELISIWASEEQPQVQKVAYHLEMSAAKVRKLLITAGVRDGRMYYDSPIALKVLQLARQGRTVDEIRQILGLSYTSVMGYLPYTKVVYSLDSLSAEAERIKLYRFRQKAVEALHAHIGLPDESTYLWKSVIAFEGFPFETAGRGKVRTGATKFKYTVTRSSNTSGLHYAGMSIQGYGNEIMVDGKEKSITRATVNLALQKALALNGMVKGPKALGLPGSGSYLYPMLIRFGMIKSDTEPIRVEGTVV